MYALNMVYVKTHYKHDSETSSIAESLDCPPQVLILKATNETTNIELQDDLSVSWRESDFKLAGGED